MGAQLDTFAKNDQTVHLQWVNYTYVKLWRRKWLPSPVFLPGESRGQRSLAGYSSWGQKESDRTEQLTLNIHSAKIEYVQEWIKSWCNQMIIWDLEASRSGPSPGAGETCGATQSPAAQKGPRLCFMLWLPSVLNFLIISPFNLCFVSEGHRISEQRGGRAVCEPRVPCRPLHTQQKDSRCPISRESWGPQCMGFLQGSEEPGGKRLPSTTG